MIPGKSNGNPAKKNKSQVQRLLIPDSSEDVVH